MQSLATTILLKCAAVADYPIRKKLNHIAAAAGVAPPTDAELEKMFPPDWATHKGDSWQQIYNSDWAKSHGGQVRTTMDNFQVSLRSKNEQRRQAAEEFKNKMDEDMWGPRPVNAGSHSQPPSPSSPHTPPSKPATTSAHSPVTSKPSRWGRNAALGLLAAGLLGTGAYTAYQAYKGQHVDD